MDVQTDTPDRIQDSEKPYVPVLAGSEQIDYEGSFYLYNPASGLFFCAGNEWGTHASLGEHGLDVELTRLDDGTYTINTQIDNGNNNRYLSAFDEGSVYCDQPATPWTLQERSDGTVTIATDDGRYLTYDGASTVLALTTNAADAKARWQLKTKDELIGQLSSASANNPKDATFLLPGANFSRNDLRNQLWIFYPTVGGENENTCGEKFNTPFDVFQELTGVPNGTYKIQAQGFYREGADENYQIDPAIALRQNGGEHHYASLYANGSSTPLKSIFDEAGCMGDGGTYSPWGNVPNTMADASQCFSAGLYENTVTVKVTDGWLYVGISKDYEVMNDWTAFDNFRLTYYGMDDITVDNITFADAEVKRICVQNWDTNGDGELSKDEAAAVTNLGEVFKRNTKIKTFNELQFFTGLTSIGNYAFHGCSGMTSITIPNTVTTIGEYAFYYCPGLSSLTIPNSVKYIEKGAFQQCYGLTSVTIPNSVTSIGDNAFSKCSGLTSVVIGSSVSSILPFAFAECNSLSSIKVVSDNPTYDSRDNCNAIIKKATNQLISGCKNTIIPLSVTSIDNFAFMGHSGLTSITIPNSITSIGNEAFAYCSNLTDVHSMIEVPFAINDNVFDNYTNATLHVPAGTKVTYQNTNGWKNFNTIMEPIENITFADAEVKRICVQNWDTNSDGELSKDEAAAVTDLGQVFKNNTKIKKFAELQNFTGLNTIGQYAFSNCTNLSTITLPATVTAIGRNAFATCGSLKSFTMPQSLKTIGIEAFAYTGLTSVTIPSSVTDISAGAFSGCVSLKKLSVKSGNTVYNSSGSCNAIIKTTTNELIQGCQSTVIPNTVTSIGKQAFLALKTLTSIDIPSSVITIAERAFEGTGLVNITIPSSVNTIGKYAFYNCTGLTEVHSLIEVPFAINNNVFQYNDNGVYFTTATLYVPAGTKSKYKATAGWKNFTNIVEEGLPEVIYGDLVLRVWKSNGQILTINLADEPRTTYSDGNLVITSTKGTVMLPLEKVKRYTYEIVENVVTDIDENKALRADFSSDGETLTLSGLKPNTVIYLYNVAGQLLRTINSGNQSKVAVSISHLPVGVYIVKANDVTYKITKR
jgi:hypothetical protein